MSVRPNFFLSMRVKNLDVLGKIHAVQNHIISQQKNLAAAAVEVIKSHITLIVFHLETENLQQAEELLQASRPFVESVLKNSPLLLSFRGISDFGKKVVFANVNDDDHLHKLQTIQGYFHETFSAHGIECQPTTFNPHLTIMKLSRCKKRGAKKIKSIPKSLYLEYEDTDFGTEDVGAIQLLKMTEGDNKGFYKCFGEVQIHKKPAPFDELNNKEEIQSRIVDIGDRFHKESPVKLQPEDTDGETPSGHDETGDPRL